jgi:hypothetical protein
MVIRVNCSSISGEGQESTRNLPFPWRPAKGGNATIVAVPVLQSSLANRSILSILGMCKLPKISTWDLE